MTRFRRLTVEEARTLTRADLLPRIEAEQAYWQRKRRRGLTAEDEAEEREFFRIMYAAIEPGAGVSDCLAYLQGVPGSGRYFDECPDIPDRPRPGQVAS